MGGLAFRMILDDSFAPIILGPESFDVWSSLELANFGAGSDENNELLNEVIVGEK